MQHRMWWRRKKSADSNADSGNVEARPLVVGTDGDLVNLDPSGTQVYAQGQILSQIFDTLFSFDENMQFQGNLAESWEYEDELTLVVHLKQGVKFSNGEELTADDVIYSFQRSKHLPNSAMQFELYDDVNSYAADKYTVKLKTTEPYSPQIYKFVWYVTSIVNKKAVEATNGEVTAESCIGTGPYKLVNWYPGDRVELTANEYYREEGLPIIKDLTFRVILESNSRAMAVESGDINRCCIRYNFRCVWNDYWIGCRILQKAGQSDYAHYGCVYGGSPNPNVYWRRSGSRYGNA